MLHLFVFMCHLCFCVCRCDVSFRRYAVSSAEDAKKVGGAFVHLLIDITSDLLAKFG